MAKHFAFSSLVGVRGAGKTTVGSLLTLTAQDMSARDPKFKIDVREKSMDLRSGVDRLMSGTYPLPTDTAQTFVAELALSFKHKFIPRVSSGVRIGLADVAGESLREVMNRFAKQDFNLDEATLAKIHDVNDFILSAGSFILAIDLDSLLIKKGSGQDPQLARFADSLLQYKEHNKRSPGVKAVAILLTKCDRVEDLLSVRDSIGLWEAAGREAFFSKFMPQTLAAMRNLPDGTVELFSSFCRPEVDAKGEPTARVKVNTASNRPEYSADEYERLIHWIHEKLT